MSHTTFNLLTLNQHTLREQLGIALASLGAWHDQASASRQFALLDDRELADIGLTRAQAPTMAIPGLWDTLR